MLHNSHFKRFISKLCSSILFNIEWSVIDTTLLLRLIQSLWLWSNCLVLLFYYMYAWFDMFTIDLALFICCDEIVKDLMDFLLEKQCFSYYLLFLLFDILVLVKKVIMEVLSGLSFCWRKFSVTTFYLLNDGSLNLILTRW